MQVQAGPMGGGFSQGLRVCMLEWVLRLAACDFSVRPTLAC